MSNLYIPLYSFIIAFLLTIIFYSKKVLQNEETKIYKFLLITSLIDCALLSLIIFLGYTQKYTIFMIKLLNRMDFTMYLLWTWAFFIYNMGVLYNFQKIKKEKYETIKKYSFYLIVILGIIMFCLPINPYNVNGVMYIDGAGSTFLYCIIAFLVVLIFVSLLINIKNVFNKKYMPLFILIIILIIALIIRNTDPTLLITSAVLSTVNFIMYFTIENPDLKMLEQLYNSKEIAEKANSNKSIFMFNVVQRIRGPIKSIKRIGEEALTMKKEEDLKEGISIIMDETKSMENFVNEVLDISTIDTSKLKVFENEYNIVALLNQVKSQFNLKLKESKKDLSFRENIEKDLPLHLYGDSIKIKQVLNTILCNSLKYTEKGFIELRVTSVIKRDICRLVITVEDSGIGMPINKISTIFENFDNEINIEKVEADNMNLPIVKKLVDFIGGNIMIESSERKGTTVTVVMDQKIGESNTETIKDLNKKYNTDMFENKKKILLVDDKESNYEYIRKFESEYGIEVIKTTTSSETYKIIREQNIELILISSNFKDMSCVDLLQRIKLSDNYKNSVVVICETHKTPEYLRVGFNDNLNTPLTKEKLKRILKKYLDI